MGNELPDVIYLCPKCLTGQEAEGQCPNDGTVLVKCHPGLSEDPQRRPIMNDDGKIVTRAPKWWLRVSVKDLMSFIDPRVNAEPGPDNEER